MAVMTTNASGASGGVQATEPSSELPDALPLVFGAITMRTDALFDRATPTLVLKVGRYRLHHGGLNVVRSLGRVGIDVYGVHEDRRTPAARSRYLCGGFVWPVPPTGDPAPATVAGPPPNVGR